MELAQLGRSEELVTVFHRGSPDRLENLAIRTKLFCVKEERITLEMSLPTLEQQPTCRFLILEQNVSFMSYLPFPVEA